MYVQAGRTTRNQLIDVECCLDFGSEARCASSWKRLEKAGGAEEDRA